MGSLPFLLALPYTRLLILSYWFHLVRNSILYLDIKALLFLFLENDQQEQ